MILFLIHDEHDIGRLNIAMNQFLTVSRDQGAGNLPDNSKSELRQQRAFSLDAPLNGLALHVLHCVVESAFGVAEMKNRRDIWMPQTGRGPGFPQEPLARRFAVQEL